MRKKVIKMGRILSFLLIFVILVTGCNRSGQSSIAASNQVKIILNGEQIALSKPPLLQKDTVYVSSEDLANLPGIKVDYNQVTGEIITTRNDATFFLQIGQPLKVGDKNGPKPFLNNDMVYLPLRDTIQRLNYGTQEETSPEGRHTIILEKLGFDVEDLWPPFSAEQLRTAEAALTSGVTINDPEADWAPISEGFQPDGRMDNGKPYPLAFTDVKSVSFGADDQYLYLKVVLYDVIPADVVYWENDEFKKTDYIQGMGCNLGLSSFLNRNTGKTDEGLMQLGVTYIEGSGRENLENPTFYTPPVVATSNFATLTGTKDKYNEDIYGVSASNGLTSGGAGKNYFMGAFPLSLFGLQLGDVIEFSISMEVGSKLFHHECVDVLLDCGYKTGETIRYQLGAGTYENLGPPKNELPLSNYKPDGSTDNKTVVLNH
jgi:hypothetical protein